MVFTAVDQRRVQFSVPTANDAVVAANINYFRAFENILLVYSRIPRPWQWWSVLLPLKSIGSKKLPTIMIAPFANRIGN